MARRVGGAETIAYCLNWNSVNFITSELRALRTGHH